MKLQNTIGANSTQPLEQHYSPEQVAKFTNFHPESIRRAVRDGRIPGVHIGRAIRISESAVRRILSEGLAGGLASRKVAQ
jgi:excisionase family DNA binding protein